MSSNLRLILKFAATGALLCGFAGMVIGMIAGMGTSVLLPGVGLVVAGSLFLGLVLGLAGALLGSLLGSFIALIIIVTRGRNYP
jgi:hypothetical protein